MVPRKASNTKENEVKSNPYVDFTGQRLFDVVRAIQALSSTVSDKTIPDMDEKLGKPLSAKSWEEVFQAHPDFFVVNPGGDNKNYVVLVYRYFKDRKQPLEPSEAGMLMNFALEMHDRAMTQRQERRWAVEKLLPPLLQGAVAALLAAGIGYYGGIRSAQVKNTAPSSVPSAIEYRYPNTIEYNVPTTNGSIFVKDEKGKPMLKVSIQKDGNLFFSRP